MCVRSVRATWPHWRMWLWAYTCWTLDDARFIDHTRSTTDVRCDEDWTPAGICWTTPETRQHIARRHGNIEVALFARSSVRARLTGPRTGHDIGIPKAVVRRISRREEEDVTGKVAVTTKL